MGEADTAPGAWESDVIGGGGIRPLALLTDIQRGGGGVSGGERRHEAVRDTAAARSVPPNKNTLTALNTHFFLIWLFK